MSAAQTFVHLLAGRRAVAKLAPREWDEVIGVARAEAMLATLAHRLEDAALPPSVAALFADQRAAAKVATAQALWEAEMARRALAPEAIEFVLLKGAAYAAAGLPCSVGRQIGDLDILVLAPDIRRAENALLNDSGGEASPDPQPDGEQGKIAAVVSLGTESATDPLPDDPKLRALYEERRELERRVEALKLMKGAMPADRYASELEKLLTDLALKTRQIREIEGKAPAPGPQDPDAGTH